MHSLGKRAYGKTYREFESPPLRVALAGDARVRAELAARAHAELLVGRAQVLLDGLVTDREIARDLEVRAAARGEKRDLALACRERGGPAVRDGRGAPHGLR